METLTSPVAPDDIDLGFVAQVVTDVDVLAVGGEQIVIGGDAQLVVLNPAASLILTFLDGEASLGELVDDFSDVLGIDRDVVEADVLSFVRELGASGLLEGVALPEPELPEGPVVTPIDAPSVGDLLDDFSLPDLDGEEHQLSDYRGERVCW
ncbi:MAG TPA: PqqD family peptide modification chaperone [Acidimicrobiia bacterium]|nr:PqqD family peptide modification chaperone [Acidimicrobiia bacterium]